MDQPIVLKGWQVAAAVLLFLLWIAGDFVWLSMFDPAVLDCLDSDRRSARRLEAIVCSPRLLGEGLAGWLALLWVWGPVAALALWLAGRARRRS